MLGGPGNDYAEWLPRLNPVELIQPGDIVGVLGGQITKVTRGAEQVMVISSAPIVAGNDPGNQARNGYSQVAFIGQVMVKVRGAVQAGDLIVASDRADGVGVAISPECIHPEDIVRVAGQAWQSSSEEGVKMVRLAVGLMRYDQTMKRLLEQELKQLAEISRLRQLNSQIQRQNEILDARVAGLEFKILGIAPGSRKLSRRRKESIERNTESTLIRNKSVSTKRQRRKSGPKARIGGV